MDSSTFILALGLVLWITGILLAHLPVPCQHQRESPCRPCADAAKRKRDDELRTEHERYHHFWGRSVPGCPHCKTR